MIHKVSQSDQKHITRWSNKCHKKIQRWSQDDPTLRWHWEKIVGAAGWKLASFVRVVSAPCSFEAGGDEDMQSVRQCSAISWPEKKSIVSQKMDSTSSQNHKKRHPKSFQNEAQNLPKFDPGGFQNRSKRASKPWCKLAWILQPS